MLARCVNMYSWYSLFDICIGGSTSISSHQINISFHIYAFQCIYMPQCTHTVVPDECSPFKALPKATRRFPSSINGPSSCEHCGLFAEFLHVCRLLFNQINPLLAASCNLRPKALAYKHACMHCAGSDSQASQLSIELQFEASLAAETALNALKRVQLVASGHHQQFECLALQICKVSALALAPVTLVPLAPPVHDQLV